MRKLRPEEQASHRTARQLHEAIEQAWHVAQQYRVSERVDESTARTLRLLSMVAYRLLQAAANIAIEMQKEELPPAARTVFIETGKEPDDTGGL